MSAWLVENAVVVAAVTLLLIVGSLPAANGRLRPWLFAVPLLTLLLGAAVFKRGVRQAELVPRSSVSSTLKYAIAEFQAARETNVLLIDGGSLAQKGIDAGLLEKELERRGYSVRAVRLALSAANHFERYELYRDLVDRLPRSAHPGQRWILLAEACVQYDLEPLAQFHGNRDTTRALHYLTPANALQAILALRDPELDPPAVGFWQWDFARQVAINAFNVGEANRLVPFDEVKADRGAVPGSRERLRRNVDIEPILSEIRRPTPDPAPPRWLKRIRERRLSQLWGDRLDEVVYFGTPSTRVDQLKHVRGVCGKTKRKCIPPTDPEQYRRLESRGYWIDEAHLNRKGAREYTKWLAQRLVEANVLHR